MTGGSVVGIRSANAARPRRWQAGGRNLCRQCGAHRAVFMRLGEVRRDRYHGLCPRCWKSEWDRNAARLLLLAS